MAATTRAETYPFEQGFPTEEAARQARDEVDFHRAIIAYRFWFPTVTFEATFQGLNEVGVYENQSVAMFALRPHHVFLTPNRDAASMFVLFDLREGPMVVELPLGPYVAVAIDHNQSWIMDVGLPGPDAGKGGKHVVLPPDHQGQLPDGVYSGRSSTHKAVVYVRAMPAPGDDLSGALESLRKVKVYALASPDEPVPVVDLTDQPTDLSARRWEDNLDYWRKLHEIIDYETVVENFAGMHGLLQALGIEKGTPFAPDERMTTILERAAREGRAQMLVSAFASSRLDRIAWPDRRWEWVSLVSDNPDWKTASGTDMEARDRWFAQAQASSPAMFGREPGAGSLYWLGARDNSGAFLDGGKTYTLKIPQPVPVKLFWSITVYDADTRSQIQTDQDKSALRSAFELADSAADEQAVLSFGPNPPADDSHWVKTTPGRGWFAYLRIFGPEQPAFGGTWRPGDFEPT